MSACQQVGAQQAVLPDAGDRRRGAEGLACVALPDRRQQPFERPPERFEFGFAARAVEPHVLAHLFVTLGEAGFRAAARGGGGGIAGHNGFDRFGHDFRLYLDNV
ncbi:MAG: hypothetical protein J0I91_16700, partial [Candidatus Accumulibacter sp.]|nr:hypothetical protein [Accumulibacter sp.]